MKQLIIIPLLLIFAGSVNAQCKDDCCKKKETVFKCKLTTPEFRERKASVIANLKKLMKGKKELKDGYAYKFSGSDPVVAQLNDFIKTEGECCDFFKFKLTVNGSKSEAWLHITGPRGVKDFIKTEMEL